MIEIWIDKIKKGGHIVKIEDSIQKGTDLILTTNTGMKVFEWIPKDRFLDIFRNPKGLSDEEISIRWNRSVNNISLEKTSNILKINTESGSIISIDVIDYFGTIISIDDEPKYYFFGMATKSSVSYKIKTNILTIKYRKRKGVFYKYELNLNSGSMKRIGSI